MKPDRDDDGDLRVGDSARVELVEKRRHEHRVGRGAREVGDRYDGARSRRLRRRIPSEVAETLASERRRQLSRGLGSEIRDGRGRGRLDDVDVEPRLHHELELSIAVRNGEIARAAGHG